jgi:hypothetical protein
LRQDPFPEALTQKAASEVLPKIDAAFLQLERSTRTRWDLETLLTQLDLFGNIGNLRLVHGEWTAVDRAKITRVIAEQFQWHQYNLTKFLRSASDEDLQSLEAQKLKLVADAWARKILPGDCIITFNWDLLHEAILWLAHKWSYVDGYGFKAPQDIIDKTPSKTMIYKLHGSVNWVQREDGMEVEDIEYVGEFFPGSHPSVRRYPPVTTSWDTGRKLILPTYLKDISRNRILLDVWGLAQEALGEAEEIVVIGYSLNPTDHPARLLLGTELRRNNSIGRVTVVGKSMGGWPDFLCTVGKQLDRKEQTFEEWALS